MIKRIISFCLMLIVVCVALSGCSSDNASWQKMHQKTTDTLILNTEPIVGSVGGEWLVIGLRQSEHLAPQTANAYLENARNYVSDVGSDRLHHVKSTENSRMILGITAAGGDPSNIAGYNLLSGLSSMKFLKAQGNNGPIWALIAFDCKDYKIPENEDADDCVTREKLVNYILSMQCKNGGWGLTADSSDIDMTAMALQSLAPYKDDEGVDSAIDKALNYLAEQQNEFGGFESYGTRNSESCAQVIVALCSLDVDPMKDKRFVKNGNTVVDALCTFAVDGGFCHQLEQPEADGIATEQAYYALAAYHRFVNKKSSLYSFG